MYIDNAENVTITEPILPRVSAKIQLGKLSPLHRNHIHVTFCIQGRQNLSIDGDLINEVDKTKFLGILIDNKLTWKQHIAYVSYV